MEYTCNCGIHVRRQFVNNNHVVTITEHVINSTINFTGMSYLHEAITNVLCSYSLLPTDLVDQC